jgi:hypothetical protein
VLRLQYTNREAEERVDNKFVLPNVTKHKFRESLTGSAVHDIQYAIIAVRKISLSDPLAKQQVAILYYYSKKIRYLYYLELNDPVVRCYTI